MKLNVGCGRDSWGDVNLEINRDYWLHKKHSINFFADARFLPFRDKCFGELRIYHVLEHIQDWEQALSECCRVSRMLSVEVPKEPIILNVWMRGMSIWFRKFSKWVLGRKEKECSCGRHLWKFNPQTVVAFLRNHGFRDVKVETIYTKRLRRELSWRIEAKN